MPAALVYFVWYIARNFPRLLETNCIATSFPSLIFRLNKVYELKISTIINFNIVFYVFLVVSAHADTRTLFIHCPEKQFAFEKRPFNLNDL